MAWKRSSVRDRSGPLKDKFPQASSKEFAGFFTLLENVQLWSLAGKKPPLELDLRPQPMGIQNHFLFV